MRTETVMCANGCGRELGTVDYDDDTPSEPQGRMCPACAAATGHEPTEAPEGAEGPDEGEPTEAPAESPETAAQTPPEGDPAPPPVQQGP